MPISFASALISFAKFFTAMLGALRVETYSYPGQYFSTKSLRVVVSNTPVHLLYGIPSLRFWSLRMHRLPSPTSPSSTKTKLWLLKLSEVIALRYLFDDWIGYT